MGVRTATWLVLIVDCLTVGAGVDITSRAWLLSSPGSLKKGKQVIEDFECHFRHHMVC